MLPAAMDTASMTLRVTTSPSATSSATDSYQLTDSEYWDPDDYSYSLNAGGTDSYNGGDVQSTLSFTTGRSGGWLLGNSPGVAASEYSLLSLIERSQFTWGQITVAFVSDTPYLSGPRAEGSSSGSPSTPTGGDSSAPPPIYRAPDLCTDVYNRLSSRSRDSQVRLPPIQLFPIWRFARRRDLRLDPLDQRRHTFRPPPRGGLVGGQHGPRPGRLDGVSRSAPPSPSNNLVALAAAGRDPADITIPTVGSKGDAGSSSSSGTSGSTSGSGFGSDAVRTGGGSGGASPSGVMVSQGVVSLPSGAGATTGESTSTGGNGSQSGSGDGEKPDLAPAGEPAGGGAAKGSPLAPVGAFFYSVFVEQPKQALRSAATAVKDTGEGLYAVATSSEAR